MSELDMWLRSLEKTDQQPAATPDLAAAAQAGAPETEAALAEDEPTPPPEAAWDSATEQEWSEHSAAAWALAHVIHHIRSTPLPPFLLPEQRQHFQKIIQTAAALIEEWQRREREQARQLAVGRSVLNLSTEPAETASEASENPTDEPAADQADQANQHHQR